MALLSNLPTHHQATRAGGRYSCVLRVLQQGCSKGSSQFAVGALLPALGVKEITVVGLRNADGAALCQEFHGRIEDIPRIRYLVWERLGEKMAKWEIVDAHVLQGKTPVDLP